MLRPEFKLVMTEIDIEDITFSW